MKIGVVLISSIFARYLIMYACAVNWKSAHYIIHYESEYVSVSVCCFPGHKDVLQHALLP